MDITYQTNYWFGFPESNSDIIINLTHWQYWWWFWFTYLLCLYYFIFLRVIRNRLMKFHPKMVTSYRAHGKWGDFIVCILPITWCVNILSNSNFILRMLEWQTESSLFTVRVRGKQWYWVYKIEVKTLLNIHQTNKNIAHNKWYAFNIVDSKSNYNYLNIIQIKDTNIWLHEYLDKYNGKFSSTYYDEQDIIFKEDFNKSKIFKKSKFFKKINLNKSPKLIKSNSKNIFGSQHVNLNNVKINENSINFLKIMAKNYQNVNKYFNNDVKENVIQFENNSMYSKILNKINSNKSLKSFNSNYEKIFGSQHINLNNIKINENSINFLKTTAENYKNINKYFNNEINSKIQYNNLNFKFLKNNSFIKDDIERFTRFNYFSKINFFSTNFFNLRFFNNFNFSNNNVVLEKNLPENIYLVIKQKKFVPVNREPFFKNKSFILNHNSYLNLIESGEKKFSNKSCTKFYFKTLKNKNLNFDNVNYRRLLRTKRILVLPINTNITIITNSFDVVHSWFIPGLGIKLDCVPGRSTHHTINIDHSGFYYGQCAEICGRYHHHMPIRICALPFEHFLIWWYHFGIPYFNCTNAKELRKKTVKSGIKQYNW